MVAAADSRPRSGAVCFVAADLTGAGPDGDIGAHLSDLGGLLAGSGWEVHFLECAAAEEGRSREAFDASNRERISFHALADLPESPSAEIQRYGGDARSLILSERLVEALEELHAEHRFDLIEFPDRGALGLRSIQVRSAGAALTDVPLAVKLYGSTQWSREQDLQLRSAPRELKLEFCERHAFEQADVQLGLSRYALDCARGLGWEVRKDARTTFPCFDPEPATQVPGVRELAFLGRLDRRGGLHLFLDALESIDLEIPVLLLGEDAPADVSSVAELIAERLGGRPHRVEGAIGRREALAALSHGDRLAVVPALGDVSGWAVAGCIAGRMPFLAAAAGAAPEVVDRARGAERWLFEPSVEGLRDALERRLGAAGSEEMELRVEVGESFDPEVWNGRVTAVYRDLVEGRKPLVVRASDPATVTVAVAHYNHDRFLPGALASLAAQTRPADEVIVIDDGSTSEVARTVFAEQEARYPDWTFMRQENAGPGVVRNRALDRAGSTYFLPFDSDNVAMPHLLERLVEAMERNPSRAATTCHNLAFVEDTEIAAGKFAFRYAPTGGPRLSACLENVYGDTCALFRAEALRSVGGFEAHRWSPHEDWETFVKMTLRGFGVEVLPQPLFYYRTHDGGRLHQLTVDPATRFRQRAHLIAEFFVDVELNARERRDLWECLLAFDRFSAEGVDELLREQRQWHDSQMADLHAWRISQLDDLRNRLGTEVEAQRARAEAAEGELASLSAITPKRLLRRAVRSARRSVSRSSRSVR